MPLYEYRCHRCGNIFEAMQKFSDEPLKTHVECGGEVERLISAPALQFKGTGWYITDYAKSGGKFPAKTDKNSESGKSESKPAESKSSSPDSSSSSSSSSTTPTKSS
ncbi:MAG: zinc ribbon domain-containing protein [Acidobacteria bacterium]|nr:zinc ribbon domain-containing protein [Acidobacteriota bacterium]